MRELEGMKDCVPWIVAGFSAMALGSVRFRVLVLLPLRWARRVVFLTEQRWRIRMRKRQSRLGGSVERGS